MADKDPSSQSYGFSSSCVWMWELDHKESWASKNWCFWAVVLEKTLEIPLDCKEIQPVHPKGNQSWIVIGRTDAEAETPTLWPVNTPKLLVIERERAEVTEELTHWKRSLGWERLKAGGEGGDTGWDGWMAPQTRWTWVWASSESWWWTRRPGMLQSMGSQTVKTRLSDWTELCIYPSTYLNMTSIYVSIILSTYLPIFLSTLFPITSMYVSIYLPMTSIHLCMFLSTYLWHLSIYVSVFLSAYLHIMSMYLSTYGWMDRLYGER